MYNPNTVDPNPEATGLEKPVWISERVAREH